MINYNLPEFKKIKIKKRKWKDNIFGLLTVAVIAGFLSGIIASSIFYGQIEKSLDRLLDEEFELSPSPRSLSQEEKIVKIVKEVSPAVVNVVATKEVTVYSLDNRGLFPSYSPDGTEEQVVGEGTGFIISKEGIVLTNKHVVIDEDASYSIIDVSGAEYSAKVLARDPIQDIAILKIQADENVVFPEVGLGDSDKIKVGQTVVAIGNALGAYQNTVSVGVVSGLGRTIRASGSNYYQVLKDVIQSDTAINKGNSGGPLLNLDGEVIGINTAIDVEGQNIAFAVPINQAKRDVNQIKKTGEIIYPFLGVRYIEIDATVQKLNNLPVDYGALVEGGVGGEPAVVSGSAADEAGIQRGDIILELNGITVNVDNSLGELIMQYRPGDEVSLKILRGSEEIYLQATLKERKI